MPRCHLLMLLLLTTAVLAQAADLRAGAASVVITPPKGAPMAGYYHNRGATGVHDDLRAKALVLESGGVKVALVACDLIGIPREVVDKARSLVEKTTGIPGERVMISATHAHTGPVILGGQSRYNLRGEMLDIARAYADSLPGRIAESVKLADTQLRPARLKAGLGHEASIAFNRRFHMKDGSVGWNPGKMNPNIVRTAGPIDPEAGVVSIDSVDGKPIAIYVNYALHLDTVGGEEYSADYPYTLSRILSDVRGAGLTTLFTIGCAGNINHIDVSTREPQRGHGEAARIGTVLAAEVLKTMARAETINADALRLAAQLVPLPPAPHDAKVEWAREVTAKFGERNAAPFLDLVRAARILDVEDRKGKTMDVEVQVIALGSEIAWVGLPGEIFVELGQAIKRGSPFRYTIVTELANGSIGYVPDRKAYAQGAYEVVSSRFAAGSGEMLVDAAVRMLVELFDASRGVSGGNAK